LVTFYLLVDASFSYQTEHLVPGVLCHVVPDWGWWLAFAAMIGWLALLVLSATGELRPGSLKKGFLQCCFPLWVSLARGTALARHLVRCVMLLSSCVRLAPHLAGDACPPDLAAVQKP
jgi:type II secretory pathway component PulF